VERQGEALLRAICEEPRDDQVRLIFADWLEDHGQPERAAFIRFQCQHPKWNSGHTMSPDLSARDREFDPFKPAWEGEVFQPKGVQWWSGWFCRGFLGFVDFLTAKAFREHGEAVFNSSPVQQVHFTRATDRTLRTILPSPLLGRLANLVLVGKMSDAAVARVAECPHLGRLESLSIWADGFGDAGAEALAASPHLGSLKKLSLSRHDIGDRGAMALAESPHLAGLDCLALNGWGNVSVTVVQQLQVRFELDGRIRTRQTSLDRSES
jgi:uncharacterized protein (TIGR02996 family)